MGAPCQHPEGSFVDIVASETLENNKGVYYVLVGWVKSLEEERYTPLMYARLYKVLDDLTVTQLKTYTFRNAMNCWSGDCWNYAYWNSGKVAVQRHSNSDHVYVFLAYSCPVLGGGCLADRYVSGGSSSYDASICDAITAKGFSNLPAIASYEYYYNVDMESPYNTESEQYLSSDYALVAFYVNGGASAKLYGAKIDFAANGGGTLSDLTQFDSASNLDSYYKPMISADPFWNGSDILGYLIWNGETSRRYSTFEGSSWSDPYWSTPNNINYLTNVYGQPDTSLSCASGQKPPMMVNKWAVARPNSTYMCQHEVEPNPSGQFDLPILSVERGTTTLNRVFGLWLDGANNVYRARRLGGIEVNTTTLESTNQYITGDSARVFSFEMREGYTDIVFKQIKIHSDGDSLSGKLENARLWIDRDENGTFLSASDTPYIATASRSGNDLAFTINGYFNSTSSTKKDRAIFFVTYEFDEDEMDDGDWFQLRLFPGNDDGVMGISAQTITNIYSPATSDPLIYAVEGMRDYLYGAVYTWEH